MGIINFERSKKLSRILSGQEPPLKKKTHAEKLQKVQIQMTAKDILKDLKEARKLLRNIETDPGLETERYLFAFRGKFHLVENGKYRKISEAEVNDLPDETQLYYICTNEGMCPLPTSYEGKKAKAVQVKDDKAVVDFIKQTTGVEIRKEDL